MRHIAGPYDVDLVHSLQLGDGALRDDDSILKQLGLRADAAELAWPQQIIAVGERSRNADTASL